MGAAAGHAETTLLSARWRDFCAAHSGTRRRTTGGQDEIAVDGAEIGIHAVAAVLPYYWRMCQRAPRAFHEHGVERISASVEESSK